MQLKSKKNLRTLIVILFLLLSFQGIAQISSKRFVTDLYMNGGVQLPQSIISTKDTGSCILGSMQNVQYYTITLSRLDKYGNLLWSNHYSVPSDSFNSSWSIRNTFDNGFIVNGNCSKNYTTLLNYDSLFLFKVDSAGNIVWAKKYPFPNAGIGDIIELHDSSIAITLGYWLGSTPVFILQKIDWNGNILWSKKVWSIYDVAEKPNHNLQIFSPSANGMYLKEFDKNGNDLWEKTYYCPGWYFNAWKLDVSKESESAIFSDIIDSTANMPRGLYVLKTDSIGNVIFSNHYAGPDSMSQPFTGEFTEDCGLMINSKIYQSFIKLDILGNVQWSKAYAYNLNPWGSWSTTSPDYGYVSLGRIASGGPLYSRIAKTDINGNTPCDDTSLSIPVTNIPLSINSTTHPSTFVTLTNTNLPILKQPISAYMVLSCLDSVIVPKITSCNLVSTGLSNVTICSNTCTTLQVYANGGISPFTYSWTPNIGTGPGPYTVCPTSTTVYSVMITDNSGATATNSSTITVLPSPKVTVNSDSICVGQTTALVASGATNYSWTPSNGLNTTSGSNVIASPTVTTSYTVTGINSNGCTGFSNSIVQVFSNPTITVDSDSICNGQSTTLTANGTNYYLWSPSSFLNTSAGPIVISTPASSLIYTVTGMDTNGCSSVNYSSVTVISNPTVAVNSGTICAGNSVALHATGAAGFSWSPSIGLSSTIGANIIANPTITTTYTVIGDNANICFNFDTSFVKVNPNPIVNVNSGNICYRNSIMLNAIGASSYNWSPGSGLNTYSGSTVIASPTVSTTYYITASDSNGCFSTAFSLVNVSPIISLPSISPLSGYAPLEITLTNQSSGIYSYFINFGDSVSNSGFLVPYHTYKDSGTYYLNIHIIDSSGCTDSIKYIIYVIQDCRQAIKIPNVFSPNEDGINDIFFVENTCFQIKSLQIFNRWGEELYLNNSPRPEWNGTFNGKKCNEGTYYYILNAIDINKKTFETKGFIELIR